MTDKNDAPVNTAIFEELGNSACTAQKEGEI